MFRRVGRDEKGASGPEYAVLLLLLVGSLVVAIGALNGATSSVFANAANNLSDAAGVSAGPSSAGSSGTGDGGTPAGSPSSSTNSPPPPHGDAPNTPGHHMHNTPCATPGAKCYAPGHNK